MVVFDSGEDSDLASNRSTPLRQVVSKFTPDPDPPPFSFFRVCPENSDSENNSPHSRAKRARKKQRGTQGEVVLLSFLGPDRPEIAKAAIDSPIHSRSTTEEAADYEDDMNISAVHGPLVAHAPPFSYHSIGRNGHSIRYSQSIMNRTPTFGRGGPAEDGDNNFDRYNTHRSPEDLYVSDRRFDRLDYSAGQYRNLARQDHDLRFSPTQPRPATSLSLSEAHHQTVNHAADGLLRLKQRPRLGSLNLPNPGLATSPGLQPLLIKPSQRSPESLLPAYKPSSPLLWRPDTGPLKAETHLPSVSQLLQSSDPSTRNRPRTGSHSSVRSTSTMAPSLPNDPFTHTRSPQRAVSQLAHSPSTARREASPSDYTSIFSPASAKSAPAQIFNPHHPSPLLSLVQPVRESAVSMSTSTSLSATMSTSSATSISSMDAFTPVSEPPSSDRQASIEVSVIPSRKGHTSSSSARAAASYGNYSVSAGGYRCTFEGCTAAPFTTQYLLNSHANVHSSERPHFCPVEGCPRGPGGQGFKRKNEMKRHGLVHSSPGYVCPFCPDREHRYPRPDNLQRHVRLHHKDRHADDSRLRDVLAQRSPGGRSKGTSRTRRGGVPAATRATK